MATGGTGDVGAAAGAGGPPLDEWARRADETLVWHLEDTRRLEMAAHAASTVEYARRVARHGAGSPAAAELATRLARSADFIAEMGAEIDRVRIPIPPRAPDVATVYGRVLDDRLTAYKGARVVAVDAAGKQLATSTTDARGSFVLAIRPTARQEKGLITTSGGGAAGEPMARLVARASDGTVLVEEATVAPRSLDAVVYRELVVPPRHT
jgi:hypothetical protein